MPRRSAARRVEHHFFYGADILQALGLDPNERYVPIARMCEALGLERAVQERRVRAHDVLAEGARTLKVELGDNVVSALCLRIDLVPLWLTGIDAARVSEDLRPRLMLFQRECASALWQGFRPQGFGLEDDLVPIRHEQSPAQSAYVSALTMGTLARQQMLIEYQLDGHGDDHAQPADPYAARTALDDPQAELLARAVRRVAQAAAERTRRNEYNGVYSGLHRQFGLSSYRRMPPARLREALEWLERWRGDLMGEPEPPPDIE